MYAESNFGLTERREADLGKNFGQFQEKIACRILQICMY
jgi:hypothetical protein